MTHFIVLFQCLQHVDAVSMVNAEWDDVGGVISYGICAMPFVPIIDVQFLPTSPLKLLQSGNFKKTEVLLGANRDEGSYFLLYFLTHLFTLDDKVSTKQSKHCCPAMLELSCEVSFSSIIDKYYKRRL